MGKGENAGNQHFLLFSPTVFSTLSKTEIIILTFNLLFANALNLDQSKVLSFGKELRVEQTNKKNNNCFRLLDRDVEDIVMSDANNLDRDRAAAANTSVTGAMSMLDQKR